MFKLYRFSQKAKNTFSLFAKLCDERQIWNAQIVGRNLFLKYPSNNDVFSNYIEFCFNVASSNEGIKSRTYFINEAEQVLSIFCEKCNMDEKSLALVYEKRSKLLSVKDEIEHDLQKEEVAAKERASIGNNKTLNDLENQISIVQNVSSQKEFDIALKEVSALEDSLQKDSFTVQQQERYDSLTKEFSSVVTETMRKLQHEKDIAYNQHAAAVYKKVFDDFKTEEKKYKKDESAFSHLIADRLCTYDTTRLFSETIIFYNYVYSTIFNAVSDDMKLKMTEYSIKNKNQ